MTQSVRTSNQVLEPEDSGSFGHTVWLILGGSALSFQKSAQILSVTPQNLHSLTHGKWKVSREYIEKKEWPKILAFHYPKDWELHKELFYAQLLHQPSRASSITKEPNDKNSFGHVLWQILGGEKAHLTSAGVALGVGRHIGNVLHGRWVISQKYLKEEGWRAKLAARYPREWKRYAGVFESRAEKLPAVATSRTPEPPNKESFGHVLWLILGGNKANLAEAAILLNITPVKLSHILHSKKAISSAFLTRNRWINILEENYSETWEQYRPLLQPYINKMASAGKTAPKPGNSPKEPTDTASFGHIVWQIIGRDEANLNQAARWLNTSRGYFRGILHATENISQEYISRNRWRQILAHHFPVAWQSLNNEYDRRAEQLPVSHKKGFSRGKRDSTLKKQVKEPDQIDSFGYTLWSILGGNKIHLGEAAAVLGLPAKTLSQILHNAKRPSMQYIKKRNWPAILAAQHPEQWNKHREAFERHSSTLYAKKAKTDPESFGHVVWLIIGGDNANLQIAAGHLGIKRAFLSNIIFKKQKVTQAWLEQHQWREHLSKHYPAAWQAHRAAFETHASALSMRRRRKASVPKDKNTFGYVLWTILGGTNCDITAASSLLGIDQRYLSGIIQGQEQTTQQYVLDKKLRDGLSTHYPETWRQHGANFETYCSQLKPSRSQLKPGCTKRTVTDTDWRQAAAGFVRRAREAQKSDYETLATASETAEFKIATNWHRVETGDSTVSPSSLRKALREICRIHTGPTAPSNQFRREAQSLIRKIK